MRALKAGLLWLLYGFLMLVVYYAHIKLFRVDVVFYAAIGDAFVAGIVLVLPLFALRSFRVFSPLEKWQMFFLWLLSGYIFAISVPTVIDRSLSFYILEKLQQRGGGIRLDRFEEVFTKEYVREHRLVDVRLTEQMSSGTIVIQAGCVRLTDRGRILAAGSRFFRRHFLPGQRLLMGRYSDDLTDPFRHSASSTDYEC